MTPVLSNGGGGCIIGVSLAVARLGQTYCRFQIVVLHASYSLVRSEFDISVASVFYLA